jgi:hypothetical protein
MKKSSIKILSLLVMMTMALSSCLNDLEDFTGQFSGSPAIAEFSEAANAATGTVGREIVDPTKPAPFSLRVNIASPYALDKATKVVVELDNSLIDEYNAERGLTGSAAAIPVPLAALTIPSYEVTVPAGKREVEWEFTVDASKVPNPVTTFYIIPVKIVSAENNVVVSGNFGTKLIRILARNEFDGEYLMNGFIMRPGDTGGLEGYFEGFEYGLITVSGNAVKMDHGQLWANGGGVGGIDAGWTITINNSTPGTSYPITLVDVTQGSNFVMVAGYPHRYEIAAKTFFWSVQWGAATPKNRGCTDTLVYVGPR